MKRLKSIFDVLATLLVIVAAGTVIWRQFAPAGQSARPRIEDASGSVAANLVTTARGDGPVVLVEFADFQCPFCGKHAREVEPRIRKEFIQTGVVRQVFLNMPLPNHPRAEPASKTALCADRQGKFWEMYEALFQAPTALEDGDLLAKADALGLDLPALQRCVASDDPKATIDRHKEAAQKFGVRSTPSFFLGVLQADGSVALKKRLNGALPYEDFRTAILGLTPAEFRGRVQKLTSNAEALAPALSVRTHRLVSF